MTTMKKFYPVIHVYKDEDAIEDLLVARNSGADGVFLISHVGRNAELLRLAKSIKSGDYKDFLIGVNLLGENAVDAIRLASVNGLDAVWTDYFDFDISVYYALKEAKSRPFQHFGGFDFKYQSPIAHYRAKTAIEYVDVLTTSGPATGHPPTLDKLNSIRQHINDFPLAVASGVNEENVKILRETADIFLVSTSICRNERLDPEKVRRFSLAIKQ